MRSAALLRAARWLPLAAALGGCANLPFFGSKEDKTSADAPAEVQVALYRVEIQAPSPLDKLLRNYLDISRFEKAPAGDAITPSELDRLAAAVPAQSRGLLETEGYFNASVTVERSTDAADLQVLRVSVVPGPRALIGDFTLDATGRVAEAARAGDAAAAGEIQSLRRNWSLQPGDPFRQGAWSDAKNKTLAQLRAEGYPTATWASTAAKVDAVENRVQLDVVADSGPLFRFGAIDVEGIERYDDGAVRRLAPFHAGEPYSEKLLLDYQERIVKSGLFEGASVEIEPETDKSDATPVHVKVKELTLQQATLGVGYSANTGPRFTLEHYHRRVFGQPWIAHNKFELGPSLKSFGTELTSYPLEDQYRNLLAANGETLRTTEEVRTAFTARVGRTQDRARIQRLYYLEAVHTRIDGNTFVTSSEAVSGNYNWILRDVDSVLLPTRGITLNAQGALGYGRGTQFERAAAIETDARGPFVRAYGRLTWYRPFGDDWHSTVRLEAGQVFAKSRIAVPDTILFRAGGEGSVRGYGYRTLGPKIFGETASGRVMMTASAEIARPVSPRLPAVWWATFIDAGNAADRWGDLRPVVGYGAGVRWRSPVGPLSVDLAYGQAVRQFRLHVSVGVTF